MVSLWIRKDRESYAGQVFSGDSRKIFFDLEDSFMLYFDSDNTFKVRVIQADGDDVVFPSNEVPIN
jgi:hypothetical protein